MYYLCIATHSHGCANINDRYVYIDFLTIIWLQVRVETTNCCKAQVASYTWF